LGLQFGRVATVVISDFFLYTDNTDF
jgi:hypothetical protein